MKKKEYTPPKMEVIEMETQSQLLSGSGDNPYWNDEQPDADNWWNQGKGWGE